MPALPISRANAWAYWSKGLIAATGVYLEADAPDFPGSGLLANVALKRNHNAIRLWLNGAKPYNISQQDIINIALSPRGWDDTALITTDGQVPLSVVTAQFTHILNTASSLGLGVLPVVDFHQAPDGKLWSNELLPDQASLKYRDALAAFWVKTLRKWRNHPALIGFDILNEPNPASNDGQYTFASFRDGTATNPKETRWPAIAQQIITAIRTEEGSTAAPLPLIVQGIYAGSVEGLGVFDAPPPNGGTGAFLMDPQNRLVYSFHTYDPACFCGQGVQSEFYEHIGTTYPLNGAVFIGGWRGGTPYHDLVNFRHADDLSKYLKTAAIFKTTYKVPVFVGEFSAAQPAINQAWPPMNRTGDSNSTYPNEVNKVSNIPLTNQEMQTKYQSFRVSNVQNNVAWEAPLLARLAAVRNQDDFNKLANSYAASSGNPTSAIYKSAFKGTNRRWITELRVDTTGIPGSNQVTVTAVFGHIDSRGFRIDTSPLSPSDLKATANWDVYLYPNDNFFLEPLARIVGSFSGLDVVTTSPHAVTSIEMTGAAYHMATSQKVRITCWKNTIQFTLPVASIPNGLLTQAVKDNIRNGVVARIDTVSGPSINVPTNELGATTALQMPVALLWLDSPYTGEQIDQARLAYMRDALHVFQANGYSWSYHADAVDSTIAAAFFRPSQQMGELMSTAAAGRRLAPR
ncbi:MAG TPA: cellulase family glycosylhydrolase [Aquabacterium sp.]|uniref:glycoside hydrolase family 5 protein n=1 Tax=Aquabacterium sp. TaxID=1872578 RepID=UPI002E32A09B|nr:cellulase family glycosylhydrolase [Aquabacterium sp.]HEX5355500.1 cellulase family glycosylhydrolase [Aquabacterium sp.]